MLTQHRLFEVLTYSPEDGTFLWKLRSGTGIRKRISGQPAGTFDGMGYARIGIDGKDYRCHRLAFLWMLGRFPDAQVDHLNGNRSDNRWINLREATASINRHNQRATRNSACGLLGVSMLRKRFRARIKVAGRTTQIGVFGTAEEAHLAYMAAKRRLHAGCV